MLECVRAADARGIMYILEHLALNFNQAKDNITVLEDPEAARKAGNIARVPVLVGTTAQDGSVYSNRLFFFFFSQLAAFLTSRLY